MGAPGDERNIAVFDGGEILLALMKAARLLEGKLRYANVVVLDERVFKCVVNAVVVRIVIVERGMVGSQDMRAFLRTWDRWQGKAEALIDGSIA